MKGALAAVLALASLSSPALAQGWQCRVPPQISVPPLPEPDAPPRVVPTTGYTLAISWSPEFCRTRKDDPRHATQCSGRQGRFGFVLHGLWPEGTGGKFPQYCPMRRLPDAQTLRRNFCTTPSAELMLHEWARHGSCMSADPAAYFDKGRALFQALQFPDMARLSRTEGLDGGKVRQAMAIANPQLKPEMIRLVLGRDGWLREIHVCHSRKLKPARCPIGNGGPPDTVPVKIWRSF
jgi:ribonuclease T2